MVDTICFPESATGINAVNKGSITSPGTDHFTNGTHTGSSPGPKLYLVCVSHMSAPAS